MKHIKLQIKTLVLLADADCTHSLFCLFLPGSRVCLIPFFRALLLMPFQVWDVLTDYERLPEFVPNLAICERLPTPEGLPKAIIRLRQVRLTITACAHTVNTSSAPLTLYQGFGRIYLYCL